MRKLLMILGLGVVMFSAPSYADGWHGHDRGEHERWEHHEDHGFYDHGGRWRIFIGSGPVIYRPYPVYAYPVQYYQAGLLNPPPYCRRYQSTMNIGGYIQQTYGTACLQPDGTWRVVN